MSFRRREGDRNRANLEVQPGFFPTGVHPEPVEGQVDVCRRGELDIFQPVQRADMRCDAQGQRMLTEPVLADSIESSCVGC